MVAETYPRTEIKYSNVSLGIGGGEVIAGIAGKQIMVLAANVVIDDSASFAVFRDGNVSPVELWGTVVGGSLFMSADGTIGPPSITLPFNPRGWFVVAAGEDLDVVIGTALVNVALTYTYV